MNVLVACEESQVVTIAFRKLGFRAFSCAHQFSAAILSGNSFSLPYQTFLKDVIL